MPTPSPAAAPAPPTLATALASFRAPRRPHHELCFWLAALGETLSTRRLLALAHQRVGPAGLVEVAGLRHLPADGTFVLAINHFRATHTADVVAAALVATARVRPDQAERAIIVVGRRERPRAPLLWPVRRLSRWLLAGWAEHRLVLPLDNRRPSLQTLRAWRARLATQPTLVFPEGKARLAFGAIRPGAGRWLATLPAPTLPVGIWWQAPGWHVRFGPPIVWAQRTDLHDRQLGLNIAALLPDPLIDHWRADLQRWRAVHAQRATAATAE